MSPVPSLTGVTSHGLGMFDFPDLQEVPRCRGLMFRSRDTPGLGGGCRLGYGDEQMTGVFDPCSWACDFQVWGSNAILKLLCIYGDPDSRLRAVLAFNTWVVWPSNYIGSLESSSRSYRVGTKRDQRENMFTWRSCFDGRQQNGNCQTEAVRITPPRCLTQLWIWSLTSSRATMSYKEMCNALLRHLSTDSVPSCLMNLSSQYQYQPKLKRVYSLVVYVLAWHWLLSHELPCKRIWRQVH